MIHPPGVDAVFFALRCQRCADRLDGPAAPALAELALGGMPRQLQAEKADATWWIRALDRRGVIATWQTQGWQDRLKTPTPAEPARRTHRDPKALLGGDYMPLLRRREPIEFGRCRRCGHSPRRQAGWVMDAATRALRAGSADVFV